MDYRVDLEIYNGPLDLLLYLIRKEEVEITDIPVGRIAEQYMAYLGLLQTMDINVAADFLVMAATLMEIKSRMILPRPEMVDEEGNVEEEDPRLELVQQLLEYKRFKEAAQDLGALGDQQLRRFGRPAAQIVIGPEEQRFALDEMLKEVQLWDLLNAFARVMRSINLSHREVVYDDTPIEEIADQIISMMRERRTALFSELVLHLFSGPVAVTRPNLIGTFLAILECIRQRLLAIEQDRDFADLRVFWREECELPPEERKTAPPEARITSVEEARQAEGLVDRPHGRFKEEVGAEDAEITEFDQVLDSISIPDVEKFKPIYSEEELLGRQEGEQGGGQAPAKGGEKAAGADGKRQQPGGVPTGRDFGSASTSLPAPTTATTAAADGGAGAGDGQGTPADSAAPDVDNPSAPAEGEAPGRPNAQAGGDQTKAQ